MRNESGLTKEDVAMLRRPYHTNAVKWLPIGKVSERGVMCMPHIDASLVIERLSDVDPGWSEVTAPVLLDVGSADPLGLAQQSPWKCELTVGGVTRTGYGQLDGMSAKLDGKHVKAGESDALKRAALKFGVGAYLRAIPTIWLSKQVGGQAAFKTSAYQGKEQFRGLTPAGKKHLRAEYEKVVRHASFVEHYGAMIDYGDMLDETEDVPVVVPEVEASSSDAAVEVLVVLSRFTGRDTPEAQVRAAAETQPFRKLAVGALSSIRQNLGCSAEDAELVRGHAEKAATGDEAAMTALGQVLDALADQAQSGEPDAQGVLA